MTDVSRNAKSPFVQWEAVTVEFDRVNLDVAVPHHLRVQDPRTIGWFVLGLPAVMTVYEGSRETWTRNEIRLRATALGTVQILLNVIE